MIKPVDNNTSMVGGVANLGIGQSRLNIDDTLGSQSIGGGN